MFAAAKQMSYATTDAKAPACSRCACRFEASLIGRIAVLAMRLFSILASLALHALVVVIRLPVRIITIVVSAVIVNGRKAFPESKAMEPCTA